MPKLPLTEMRAQVFTLCADNRVHITFGGDHDDFSAELDKNAILIKPIKSTITYVLCLHELGHLLSKKALKARQELMCEAYAWQWAERNAIVWNDVARRHRDMCLKMYLDAEKEPSKRSLFWKVYQKK